MQISQLIIGAFFSSVAIAAPVAVADPQGAALSNALQNAGDSLYSLGADFFSLGGNTVNVAATGAGAVGTAALAGTSDVFSGLGKGLGAAAQGSSSLTNAFSDFLASLTPEPARRPGRPARQQSA